MILLHALPASIRRDALTVFHIGQAVPVFFVLMGLNLGLALGRRGPRNLRDIYEKEYFVKRLKRVGLPFLAMVLASLIIAYAVLSRGYDVEVKVGFFRTVFGLLPTGGPGDYFTPILFQFTVLIGLLYRLYLYNPKIMLICAFAVDLAYELFAPHVPLFSAMPGLYAASIFRYLFAIGLGLWIANNLKFGKFLLMGAAASSLYLVAGTFFSYQVPYFLTDRETQNLLSYFYPLVLVVAGLRYLPTSSLNSATNGLATIGRASYHIFLVQILFFGYFEPHVPVRNIGMSFSYFGVGLGVMLTTLAACILGGLMFMYGEAKIETRMAHRIETASD